MVSTTSANTKQDSLALDVMESFVSSRLLVVANLIRRAAAHRYSRLLQLSPVEFGIVAMLGPRDPTPVRALALMLGMDKAQLSRALSTLARRGLIVRQAGTSDQRDVLVSLTENGLAAHDTIIEAATRVNARLLADWTPDMQERFSELLQSIEAMAETLLQEELQIPRKTRSDK